MPSNNHKGPRMKLTVISRAEAHAQGLRRFYTGKPCKYGHDSQRFVSTGGCCACNAGRSKVFSKAISSGGKVFSYPAHADDMAALLAYAQALDIQRGRVPFVPAPPKGAELPALPADLARHRETLAAAHTIPAAPAYLPKP